MNIFTYRIDAFLSNLSDFFGILTFNILIYNFLNLIKVTFKEIIYSLFIISIAIHFLYLIVYLINDYIDYNKVINYDILKYTFYKYRPIIYFKKENIFIFTILFWYFICIYLIKIIFNMPFILILLIVLLFASFSLIRSINEGVIKIILFGILRFIKYICLNIFLNIYLFKTIYKDVTSFIILFLILPYIIYNIIKYIGQLKEFILLKNKRGLIVTITCLLIFYFLSHFIRSDYSTLKVLRFTIFGYILIIIPRIFAHFLPALILKSKKLNFQSYLLNLTISLIITSLWCVNISYWIMK